jgi:hypothetical protein
MLLAFIKLKACNTVFDSNEKLHYSLKTEKNLLLIDIWECNESETNDFEDDDDTDSHLDSYFKIGITLIIRSQYFCVQNEASFLKTSFSSPLYIIFRNLRI